jgi:hypothetical protein
MRRLLRRCLAALASPTTQVCGVTPKLRGWRGACAQGGGPAVCSRGSRTAWSPGRTHGSRWKRRFDVCWSFGALQFLSGPIHGALHISLRLSDLHRFDKPRAMGSSLRPPRRHRQSGRLQCLPVRTSLQVLRSDDSLIANTNVAALPTSFCCHHARGIIAMTAGDTAMQ